MIFKPVCNYYCKFFLKNTCKVENIDSMLKYFALQVGACCVWLYVYCMSRILYKINKRI